jgi:hypothetical protein
MEVGQMTNSSLGNDPILIWQHQDIMGETMSAQEIRKTAQAFQSKSKLRRAIFGLAFILYLALSLVVRMSSAERHVLHVGWVGIVRFGLLIVWILGLRYYEADRLTSLNLNAGSTGGFEFYRRGLLVQIDYFRNTIRWLPGLLIVVLFFAATLATDRSLAVPLGILFVIFGGYWYMQWKRDLPQLQAEIEALEAFRKSDRAV